MNAAAGEVDGSIGAGVDAALRTGRSSPTWDRGNLCRGPAIGVSIRRKIEHGCFKIEMCMKKVCRAKAISNAAARCCSHPPAANSTRNAKLDGTYRRGGCSRRGRM